MFQGYTTSDGSGLPTGSGSGSGGSGGGGGTPPTQTPSDGHTYLIQNSPNSSGLNWLTVYEFDNATDTSEVYDSVKGTGFWQILRDGVIWDTNLAEGDRWKEGGDESDLRDVWNVEADVNGTWTFIAEAGSLADAQSKLASIRAGTYAASIPPQSDLRITDKTGAVVQTDKGKEPTPGEEADSYTDKDGKTHWKWKDGTWHDSPEGMYQWPDGSWQDTPYVASDPGSVEPSVTGDTKGIILIVAAVGIGLFLLWMISKQVVVGAKHATP